MTVAPVRAQLSSDEAPCRVCFVHVRREAWATHWTFEHEKDAPDFQAVYEWYWSDAGNPHAQRLRKYEERHVQMARKIRNYRRAVKQINAALSMAQKVSEAHCSTSVMRATQLSEAQRELARLRQTPSTVRLLNVLDVLQMAALGLGLLAVIVLIPVTLWKVVTWVW